MNENNNVNHQSDEEKLIRVINTGAKSRVASNKKRLSGILVAVFFGICFFISYSFILFKVTINFVPRS